MSGVPDGRGAGSDGMDAATGYMGIISGDQRGAWAACARGSLGAASLLYRSAVSLRNLWYDRWSLPVWLGVPVISVGNLTVGGTGKTPMTLWLCEHLAARGMKPAVLSRGYKATAEGAADELLLVSRRCPQAVAIAHPNRAASGAMAIEEYKADAIVLDDGFQHRRVGRDLDLVLIDATCPFGYGHMLPRGLLRESLRGLRRADAVVLTRCDQCPQADLWAIEQQVRRWNPAVPIARSVHRAVGFTDLAGTVTDRPSVGKVGALAGIARPRAFEDTLVSLDVPPAATFWWPDHHDYSAAHVEELVAWIREESLDAVVTTEKDAVKLASLEADWPVPIRALRVKMAFLDDGEAVLSRLIDATLKEYEEAP